MGILWKCCIRAMKEKKSRTMVTILGVAMATMLITTLACMGSSMLESIRVYVQNTQGMAHETYYGVEQENLKYFLQNQSVDKVWLEKQLGYGTFSLKGEDTSKYLLHLCAAGDGWYEAKALKVVSGRLSQTENEIVLPKAVRSELGYDVKLGDSIETSFGEEKKMLSVVGFYEREDAGIEFDYGFDYFESFEDEEQHMRYRLIKAYACLEENAAATGKYDVSVHFTKAGLFQREEVSGALRECAEKMERNGDLEAWDSLSPFHLTMQSVWGIAFFEVIFLLFVLAGVFCINNSFDISITERIRFFGMISCVGTTKRQRRLMVWMEAFVIGVTGIPLGILLGAGLSLGLVAGTNLAIRTFVRTIQFSLHFRLAWWAILIAALQSMLMVVLSAMEAAFWAGRISPMEAIRSNQTLKSKGKLGRVPKLLQKAFGVGGGIAWRNFQRSKIKYRATIVSIVVSVSLVLGMTFLPFFFQYLQTELMGVADYQVKVTIRHDNGHDEMRRMADWQGVTGCVIERCPVAIYEPRESAQESVQLVCALIAWENEEFERLCRDNGIDPKTVQGKGLIASGAKNMREGQILEGINYFSVPKEGEYDPVSVRVEIGGTIDESTLYGGISLYAAGYQVYVNESWVQAHPALFDGGAYGYFLCEDANDLVERIKAEDLLDAEVINFDQMFQLLRLAKILVTMFMIGFLGLIMLIGVTNIINAVNFNLQMRAPEFAKLSAIGMTARQFRDMMHLEGVFIAGKGLFWGYLIGCGIYWGLWRSFVGSADMLWLDPEKKVQYAFHVPWGQMACCAVTVGALLHAVIRFNVCKARKRNVIETMRNENV